MDSLLQGAHGVIKRLSILSVLLVAGWLADDYSFGAAFGVTAGVLALGLVSAVFSRETKHRPVTPPPADSPAPTG